LKEIQVHGIPQDVFTYASLFDWLCEDGHMDGITILLKEMRNNKVAPNIVISNIQRGSLCESGCVKDAKDFFYEHLSRGLEANCIM